MGLKEVHEFIRINNGSITIKMVRLLGKEGDHYVILSPAIEVSGYGKTRGDAEESFKENMDLFCEDLMTLDKDERDKQLRLLGFRREKYHRKNYSKVYVDQAGALQNFDAGTVEKVIMETTACA